MGPNANSASAPTTAVEAAHHATTMESAHRTTAEATTGAAEATAHAIARHVSR